MKNTLSIALLMFCFLTAAWTLEAQRFIGYVAGGVNFAQIEGDDVHGFQKVRANAGLGIKLPLNERQTWSVSMELLFSQKGSYKHYKTAGEFDTTKYAEELFYDVDRSASFDPLTKCNISLDYIQIPLFARYEDPRTGFSFGLGFAWGRLVRAKDIYNGFLRTTSIQSRPKVYNYSDWTALVDVDIRLYKNLSLGIRWEHSLVPVREMTVGFVKDFNNIEYEQRKFYNHSVALRLVYYINEKFEKNTKTNAKGERIGTPWIRVVPEYN